MNPSEAPRRYGVGPVHHIALSVRSMEEASRFYGGVLGMKRTLVTHPEGPGFEQVMHVHAGARANVCYFEGGIKSGQIELIEWVDPPEQPHFEYSSRYDVMVLAFEVPRDQLDGYVARAEAEGFDIDSHPVDMPLPNYGTVRSAILVDPDGHRIELVALPSREEVLALRAQTPGAERSSPRSGDGASPAPS